MTAQVTKRRTGSRWFRGLLGLAAVLGGSCSDSNAPPRGQLMIALATDMSIPKDVTTIRVKVKLNAEVRYEYDFAIAPDGEFHIPGTVAVVEGSTPNPVVAVEVVGIRTRKSGAVEARTFSKSVTTIPRERIATLRIPVQWLCDGTAVDDGTGEYLSTCAPENGEETACRAGECKPVAVPPETLETFDPKALYGGAATPEDPLARCFDTVACFEKGADLEVPDGQDCVLSVAGEPSQLNVALRMPASGDGICPEGNNEGGCFVPLDQDRDWGWSFEPGAEAGRTTLRLPRAACEAVRKGRALGLRVSSACESKTSKYPTCGPWSAVERAFTSQPQGGSGGSGGSSASTQGGTLGTETTANRGGTTGTLASSGSAGEPTTSGGAAGGAAEGGAGGDTSSVQGGEAGQAGGTDVGPTSCVGDIVFPDAAVEAIVRTRLEKPEGPISALEVASLTSLELNQVSDLKGLECFTSLTSLRISGPEDVPDVRPGVSDLSPLARLRGLTSLIIETQNVADLGPLRDLNRLATLSLRRNHIDDVTPLANLTELDELDISQNRLSDVRALAALTKLGALRTDAVGDLSFLRELPALRKLWLESGTAPIAPAVQALTQLTELSLNDLDLTGVSALSDLVNLETLVLKNNPIRSLTGLSNLTRLRILDLSYTLVIDLSELTNLINLRELNLEGTEANDFSALIQNEGFGQGASLILNRSDCSEQIWALQERGVVVSYQENCESF
ncbi:MAG TPA: leucine-rich repeat domain-containing protein [Polyangiaceae bacterium]|nr:leucine-rich repeat domain-containing protein [Polyangiaceae bacterium]